MIARAFREERTLRLGKEAYHVKTLLSEPGDKDVTIEVKERDLSQGDGMKRSQRLRWRDGSEGQ